jgi:transposase
MKLKDEIFKLKKEGYSYRDIQKELNCSKGTISYHLGVGQKDKVDKRRIDARGKITRYIQEYKSSKSCADCKENYPYWILEFDHLGNKEFNISQHRIHTISLDRVKEEIQKCEVVCSNCHKNRTFNRRIKNADNVGLEFCNYPE